MLRTRDATLRPSVAWIAMAIAECLFLAQSASGGFYCSTPDLEIPDVALVSDDLIVTGHLAITDLNLRILADHTWVGDLVFTLEKTEGDGSETGQVVLMDRPSFPAFVDGCGMDDIELFLDDESENGAIEDQCEQPLGANGPYTPDSPLSAFDGVDVAGTWRLVVTDNHEFDTGTLTQWCLITLSLLDVDGDGEVAPLTDGLLILRHRFGFTGSVLVTGAVDVVNCTRCEAADIKVYLDELP